MTTILKNPLKKISESSREKTPEEIRQLEERRKHLAEEKQRKEEELIQIEGEIKALFKEYTIYGKKSYAAKVPKLLKYLKSDLNAVKFWQDRHIRKNYNITNEVNFLFSIYTEEDDDKMHEIWSHRNLSNPFADTWIVDYNSGYYIDDLENLFESGETYASKRIILGRDATEEEINDLERSHIIKMREFKDLLDKKYFREHCFFPDDVIYFINPLIITDNNFLRLDTYDVWRESLENTWVYVERRAPIMIKLLDELVRTRKIYLTEMKKNKKPGRYY